MQIACCAYVASLIAVAKADELPATFSSENALISYIDELNTSHPSDPNSVIELTNQLIDYALKNEWQEAYLHAAVLKFENLLEQDNIAQANMLYQNIYQKAKAVNNDHILYLLAVNELDLRFSLGEDVDFDALYLPLIERAKKTDNPYVITNIYFAIGLNQYERDLFADAIQSLEKAYQSSKSVDDTFALSQILTQLSNIYFDLGDFPLGIRYSEEALAIAKQIRDLFSESVILYNLGSAYFSHKNYETAENYLNEALALSKKLNDDIGVAWAQASLADIALENKDWMYALDLYAQAEQVFAMTGDPELEFGAIIGQVRAKLELGAYAEALSKLDTTYDFIKNTKRLRSQIDYTKIYAQIRYAQQDYKHAYDKLEEVITLLEQRYENEQAQDIQKYKIKFDTQLKESQNALLLKENEIQSLQLETQERQQKLWIIFVCLTLGFMFIQMWHRQRFKRMALHDYLTNSPNRRAVLAYANDCYRQAEHGNTPLSFGIMDLDNFKSINDKYGHEVGDQILKRFSKACQAVFNSKEQYGRYGGEEWLFVTNEQNKEAIQALFEKLRSEFNSTKSDTSPIEIEVTFSMGVAYYKKGKDHDINGIIARADSNLYLAKQQGRDRLVVDE
ncbi:tetratricopeptide repeat-containing diguanylate cyclase [Agaribacter flavus]|uniref:diguanylate cyclase n=1 Tax=Agaribacter flavus TaxID=1902781 RepID=A0ABV7FVA9_9ALTE